MNITDKRYEKEVLYLLTINFINDKHNEVIKMTKKLRFNNTYNCGSVTFLVLPEKNKYLGVCLEFDLVVRADTLKEAKEEIEDYAKLWHRNAVKHKLPEELLNKPAPKEYWKIYEKLVEQDLKRIEAEKQTSKNIDIEPQRVVSCQSPYPNFAFT